MEKIKRNRIGVTYTAREWKQIEDEVKKLGKKHPIQYLISEVKILDSSPLKFHSFPESFLKPIKKDLYPPDETFEIIKNLADKLNLDRATLVSRLIFNPLLKK